MASQARTEDLTNVEVVTYALAQLQEKGKPVHLERIAAKAFEFAPGSFRWDLDEFMGFIDKDKVRVSLVDAGRPKDGRGSLVQAVGVRRGGQSKRSDLWRLTDAGAAWVLEHEGRLAEALRRPAPALKRGKADALRKRLTGNPLWREFADSNRVSENPYAFTDLLECSPDASNNVVSQRLDELNMQVRMLEEPELLDFLAACRRAHADMLEIS